MTTKRISTAFLVLLLLYLPLACKETIVDNKHERTVEIREETGKFQLYRNGSPYFVKGAGGYEHFEEIKASGGNSIRIWSTDNAQEILDRAHELGLSVTVGLKVAYAKKDMNYGDRESVAAQKERLKKEVLKYKDHPALLMWGVGNEPTLHLHPLSTIEHNQTWSAINDIAKMIHELDPNHPTTTMLQDLPEKTIIYISKFCENIDIISINIFRDTGGEKIADILTSYGWNGPFLISEYGAIGYWGEVNYTDWYALREKTSTQKAQFIQDFYQYQIAAEQNRCLGSYVFYWGQKQEYTTTWLSLFTETGARTEIIDRMQYLWTGEWPMNMAPSIHSLTINRQEGGNTYLYNQSAFTVTINAIDPEQRKLTIQWEILKDDTERHFDATYNQDKPRLIESGCTDIATRVTTALEKNHNYKSFNIKPRTPVEEGAYRLFVYVMDEMGKVATANETFYVVR